jgi:hypothetical protein
MRTSGGVVTYRDDVWVVEAAFPSQVKVFVKSLHLLAVAWIATVVAVWMTLEPNRPFGADMLVRAGLPVIAIESFAWWFDHWTSEVGGRMRAHMSEWGRALQWNIVPMIFLAVAAAAM